MAEKKLSYTAAEIDTLLGEIKKISQSGYAGEEIVNLLGELENLIQLNENGELGGEDERVEDILTSLSVVDEQLDNIRTQFADIDTDIDGINAQLEDMEEEISKTNNLPTKVSELENDKGYITETELNDKIQLMNPDFTLGVHSDGGIYLFVNGEPVGMGIFISDVEINVSGGYVADDNTIMLSDNIPSGTYSMKYENEDGTYSLIGNFTI